MAICDDVADLDVVPRDLLDNELVAFSQEGLHALTMEIERVLTIGDSDLDLTSDLERPGMVHVDGSGPTLRSR